jgi:hypothetical protein
VTTGSPALTNVDIETAACGQGCTAVGVLSVAASPVFTGVDVFGRTVGFDPIDVLVGFDLIGGSPQIVGSSSTRTIGDGGRGGVLLNVPVNVSATGVRAQMSSVVLQGITVEGGLGLFLAGISLYGSEATVDGCAVSLTGFGTRIMTGITANACSADKDCTCPSQVPQCTPPAPGTQLPQKTTIAGNTICRLAPTSRAWSHARA